MNTIPLIINMSDPVVLNEKAVRKVCVCECAHGVRLHLLDENMFAAGENMVHSLS